MNVIAIVQARTGSTRLPNKTMRRISGVPLIELLLLRLNGSKNISQVVLATTVSERDDDIAKHVNSMGIPVFRGSEKDVLDRYFKASRSFSADVIVRITGDCPLIDPDIVDSVIDSFLSNEVDYVCNRNPSSFPDGLDTEVFTQRALETAWREATDSYDREHVTPYILRSKRFQKETVIYPEDYSNERWTVDEPEDLVVVDRIYKHFAPRIDFSWLEVIDLRKIDSSIFSANEAIKRNEGATMNTGQKLWTRAKRVIPGGNMLLSKRPEMFLPNAWPTYYASASGCRLRDLDGNEYIDMSLMGVGTNVLGYAHPEVDLAVSKVISSGNMSTLNCPEEVYLAETLIELHPWAEMARFARSGGEANAIAIRIARAASGKTKVAICGYHGWHDWYLSANLRGDGNLSEHLLPGLEPNGVPDNLVGTVYPFEYNRFEALREIVTEHDIGVIKMEVSRNEEPLEGFLQKIRNLATENGIVLIFDECTSGFRETNGGLHKKYAVEPDMAVFGKALGNGYAITSILGRREVMEAAQSTFISSTFWTERIGPTAGLKVLEVMKRDETWSQITRIGESVREKWKELALRYDLDLRHWGLPALAGFTVNSPRALEYKTLITQEMLKKGYLASNSVYACAEHSNEILNGYFNALEPIFMSIKDCEDGLDVETLLDGPVCHSGFTRLN